MTFFLKAVVVIVSMFAASILFLGLFAIPTLWIDFHCPEPDTDVLGVGRHLIEWIILVLLSIIFLSIKKIRKFISNF
jgi:hypothetical protein